MLLNRDLMQTAPQPHFWRYLVAVLLPTLLIIPSVVAVLTHLATDEGIVRREQQGLEQIRRLNGAITLLHQCAVPIRWFCGVAIRP